MDLILLTLSSLVLYSGGVFSLSMDVLKIRSFLKENNTPCCVEEIEKATGYSKDDLLSCLNDDENIGRSELFPGLFGLFVFLFWFSHFFFFLLFSLVF